jgi:hypothetical protein
MRDSFRSCFATSVLALVAALNGCAKEPEQDFRLGLGATGGGAGTGTGTGGGSSATGGGSMVGGSAGSGVSVAGRPSSGTGGTINLDGSVSDAQEELDEDAACGTGKADANLLPVNLMMMFDRSGSMVDEDSVDPVTGLNRWETATGGLVTFFQDPTAEGLGVALRFFPHDLPEAGCTSLDDACDAVACSKVLVDMGWLTADPAPTDVQEGLLVDAIAASPPPAPGAGSQGAGTPIYAALDGALRWATAYQMAHEDQKTVVVFVTDGEPNGCNEDFDDISQLAADALAMSGVTTYAIGLADSSGNGLNTQDMDQLAEAGGTDQAFFINDGPTAAEALTETFNAIRGMSLSCEFPMPEATDDGDVIEPTLVNVNFTAGDGTATTLTKVASAADCGAAKSWYYDDEAMPTRILLCPASCEVVSADPKGKIEVLVGCKPQIEPPH